MVFAIPRTNKTYVESGLPLSIKLTLHYAVKHEMAMTPVDFFMRRTGAIFFDINWVQNWKQHVIDYMAEIFEWSHEGKNKMAEELDSRIAEAIHS